MAAALNIVLFQAGWFACVLGAAHGRPLAGAAAALAIASGWILRAPRPGRELALVLAASLAGLALDSLLAQSGWVAFESALPAAGLAPVWMLALWALFAVTLNVSLRWLRHRLLLAGALGALGGPAAYYAGGKLGALSFADAPAALVLIALGWAFATPALLALARRLEPA